MLLSVLKCMGVHELE